MSVSDSFLNGDSAARASESGWTRREAELATGKLDDLAMLRDFIAYGRDRHAAALDREEREADMVCESLTEMRARAQSARERAALDRAHAAADREAAARDRQVAAEARQGPEGIA